MPTKSIYFPDELWEQVQQEMDEDDNLSELVQSTLRREFEGEFDDLEELTGQVEELRLAVEDLQDWRADTMSSVAQWFTSEFGPAE